MNPYLRHILIGSGVVLGFDTLASFTSLATGVPYVWFTIGSVVIYFIFSYVAAPVFGLGRAVVATVLLAMVDGSAGWAISWVIGPGRDGVEDLGVATLMILAVIGMAIYGTVIGLVGGGIARARMKS